MANTIMTSDLRCRIKWQLDAECVEVLIDTKLYYPTEDIHMYSKLNWSVIREI
jgi:hypothetical protein